MKLSTMSIQDFLIPVSYCLLSISIWFLLRSKNKAAGSKAMPPGPSKLPLIGNLHQLGALPHNSLHTLSIKYGPLMSIQLGSIPAIVVSSADIAEEIFKNHDLAFSDRGASCVAKKLSYNFSDISFAPYSKSQWEFKKIVTSELLNTKKVQSFQEVRKEEVQLMLDAIAHSSEPVELGELVLSLAINVMCRVAFGEKYDGGKSASDKNRSFNEMVREAESLLGGFWLADFFPWMGWLNKFNGLETRLERNSKEQDMLYNKVIEKHLARRRSTAEHEDLVDILLKVQKDSTQGTPLTNEQIKGMIMDIFTAGTDTASVTVEWAMTELMRNPAAMKKAQDEVRDATKGKSGVDENDLPNLFYLKSAIKETLRLHTPVPLIPRGTAKSCTIKGYEIPPKIKVFINTKSISTDPKYWENPDGYRPERFLDNSIDFRGQNFGFIPFGAGRRICPGINYATMLVELVLANLLLHFNWKMPDGECAEYMNMEEGSGLTIHKKFPLRLVAIPVIV